MRAFLILSLIMLAAPCSLHAQGTALRTGRHGLTLQWISWEKQGAATVTKEGPGYRIRGVQRSADEQDSCSINGRIQVVSPKELRFTGIIITRVSHIQAGEPCVRDGEYTFLSTGKRRYWRLQDMLNCDGVVTDYVDIYF